MPLRRCYSLEERVIIANTVLLPTLGYTQRLFVMPEHLIDLVIKRLSPWLAPASRFAPGLLCSPARSTGITTPRAISRDVQPCCPPAPPQPQGTISLGLCLSPRHVLSPCELTFSPSDSKYPLSPPSLTAAAIPFAASEQTRPSRFPPACLAQINSQPQARCLPEPAPALLR